MITIGLSVVSWLISRKPEATAKERETGANLQLIAIILSSASLLITAYDYFRQQRR